MSIRQTGADMYELAAGIRIPSIGFGTWQLQEGQEAEQAVIQALELGYRHIDTAAAYGNEKSVGLGLRKSGIPRDQVFITSKLRNSDHGYEATRKAFELTMANLCLDYLDLYLIHWPNPVQFRENWEESNAESWRAIEKFYREGRIKAIGLSNFRPHHVEALRKTAETEPMVNQIRLCPGDVHKETVDYCFTHDILLEGYSPMGTGKIFLVPEMQALSRKYKKTISQICIRWSLQNRFLPLPKSNSKDHMRENLEVFDFTLEEKDMAIITGLTGCCGFANDPDNIQFLG